MTIEQNVLKAMQEIHKLSPTIFDECIKRNYYMAYYVVNDGRSFVMVDFTRSHIQDPREFMNYAAIIFRDWIKYEKMYDQTPKC